MIVSALALAAAAADMPPERPFVFVANPTFDMESGVRTFDSLARLAFLYDSALVAAVDLDETSPLGKAAGISGRLLKGVVIDLPLVVLEVTFIHEVYGHGARGREAGLHPTYEFHLVSPYSQLLSKPDPDAPLAVARVGSTGSLDTNLLVDAAGIESGYVIAWWTQIGALERDGWLHYREMLGYGSAKLSYAFSLAGDLSVIRPKQATNDAAAYVTDLQRVTNRWRPEDRADIARDLRVAYLFNFVDPTLWLSAFHGVWTYGVQGERYARLPMIPVGPYRVYPATRFALGPWGAEHAVDLFALRGGVVFDVYGRATSSGLASSIGLGTRVFGVEVGRRGRVGAELDLWRQPDVLLDDRFVFDRGDRVGGNLGVHGDWGVTAQVGVVGKLAYKTEGYLLGQPLDRGPYGYLGVSVRP